MLHKQRVAAKMLTLEDNSYEFDYYITAKPSENGGMLYGICIEKYFMPDNKKLLTDTDMVDGVTYSHDEIQDIIKKLISGIATPVTLRYILEDLTKDLALSSINPKEAV